MPSAKILNGPSENVLSTIADESADLCVTSPPYKNKDGYSYGLMVKVFLQLYRIMKPNSLCFVNFGHLNESKSRPFEVCLCIETIGFKLMDTIIWVKNHYTPLQGDNLNNLHEFIFMFRKGKMPHIDRLSIGVPYKDKSNIGRYSNVDLKCGGNLWYIDYKTVTNSDQKTHKDGFPVELPIRCIKLSSIKKGSSVIDPFSGSATTGIAALKLGMNYVGIEKDLDTYNKSLERIKNEP